MNIWMGLFGGIIAFVCGALLTIVGQQSIASTYSTTSQPLTDRLHRPEWANLAQYYYICDALSICLVPCMCAYAIAYGDLRMGISYLWTQGALFALRPLFFWPTTLPNCSPLPMKPWYNDRHPVRILWQYATLQDPHQGHQSDLVFSGHMASMYTHVLMLSFFALDLSAEMSMLACVYAAAILTWLFAPLPNRSELPLLILSPLVAWHSVPFLGHAVALWIVAHFTAIGIVVTRCHYSLCVIVSLPVAYSLFRLVSLPIASCIEF